MLLNFEDKSIDITRFGAEPTEPISQFMHEETIDPQQIEDYKVRFHREIMKQWFNNNVDIVQRLHFDDVWRIREECIAALSQ